MSFKLIGPDGCSKIYNRIVIMVDADGNCKMSMNGDKKYLTRSDKEMLIEMIKNIEMHIEPNGDAHYMGTVDHVSLENGPLRDVLIAVFVKHP